MQRCVKKFQTTLDLLAVERPSDPSRPREETYTGARRLRSIISVYESRSNETKRGKKTFFLAMKVSNGIMKKLFLALPVVLNEAALTHE